MTLFDLALKNVQRNMKSYGLYIGSMIFSIVIYFTFVTLRYSDDISMLEGSSIKIEGIMKMSAIILLIFVAIFIAYSNSFFLKKRKKEVGLYSLLGVRKRQIGFLLFFENLIIGLFSLVVGIVVGFFLSKVLLTILIRLMGFEVVAGFSFSSEAIINTAVVFFLLFLFTSLQGYFVIYRFQLIDLFRAEQKGEELPKARWIAALLGVGMLAFGYWLAAQNILTSTVWSKIGLLQTPLLIIVLTVVGTYLLFHSVMVYVLTKFKQNERWAWRGLNMMTVSQLLYRIRGNAKTLTIIAILSATTITAGGAVFSLYYTNEKDTQAYLPHTFMWEGEAVADVEGDVQYTAGFQAKEQQLQMENGEYYFNVVSEATYKQLAQLTNNEAESLKDGEVLVLDPYFDPRYGEDYTNEVVTLNETSYTVKKHAKTSIVNTQLMPIVLVVKESVFEAIAAEALPYQVMELADEKNQLAASLALREQLGEETLFSSYPQSYSDSLQSLGTLLFVGTFLGLVFLVATGSIIYFKMMTEAEEDRAKYEVMHKIGVSEREMTKTIRAQVATVFAVPLLAGILHSAFALQAFANLFMFNILQPVIIWMAAYACIYFVYYLFTVAYFKKTVQQTIKNEG